MFIVGSIIDWVRVFLLLFARMILSVPVLVRDWEPRGPCWSG